VQRLSPADCLRLDRCRTAIQLITEL